MASNQWISKLTAIHQMLPCSCLPIPPHLVLMLRQGQQGSSEVASHGCHMAFGSSISSDKILDFEKVPSESLPCFHGIIGWKSWALAFLFEKMSIIFQSKCALTFAWFHLGWELPPRASISLKAFNENSRVEVLFPTSCDFIPKKRTANELGCLYTWCSPMDLLGRHPIRSWRFVELLEVFPWRAVREVVQSWSCQSVLGQVAIKKNGWLTQQEFISHSSGACRVNVPPGLPSGDQLLREPLRSSGEGTGSSLCMSPWLLAHNRRSINVY